MIIKSKKFNHLMRGNMSENIQLEIVFSIAFCFQHQMREKTTMMQWRLLINQK